MLFVYASNDTKPDASTAVRNLLRQAYAHSVGDSMPQVIKAPGGKPDFVDSKWHFSICHTRQAVLCAISDAPVGLDSERLRPIRPEVVSRVLAPAELAQYDGSTEMFMRFWTLKEAYAKYTGEGIYGFPNQFVFHLTPDGALMEGNDLYFSVVRQRDYIITTCTPSEEKLNPFWY